MNHLSGPVVIMLGSNQGDRLDYLSKAKEKTGEHIGKIITQSSIYETAAWGNENQHAFLNQVIILKTFFDPSRLLKELLLLEQGLGRSRTEKWAPRTIDLDILFYEDQIMEDKKLKIPHPRIQDRRFTLMPLVEIMPGFVHPVLSVNMLQLLNQCTDKLPVFKIADTSGVSPSL